MIFNNIKKHHDLLTYCHGYLNPRWYSASPTTCSHLSLSLASAFWFPCRPCYVWQAFVNYYGYFLCVFLSKCPDHLNLLSLITLTIIYNSLISLLCFLLQTLLPVSDHTFFWSILLSKDIHILA